MSLSLAKLEAFRQMVEMQQAERVRRKSQDVQPPEVRIKSGRRWFKVDVGDSGKYMVDMDGSIYGIKAYGVPHRGYYYGTLDTIADWDWSDYTAVKRATPKMP